MRFSKIAICALILCAALLAVGCADKGSGVYVQSVADLCGYAQSGTDAFSGVVASESVCEVSRDADKKIDETFVSVGDSVGEGDKLFCYDSDDLQLKLDKEKLELEQLKASVEDYKRQIDELEAEKKAAAADMQLQYTVQIQSVKLDLKEAQINCASKQESVDKSAEMLKDTEVTSPVSGRVTWIADGESSGAVYIKIQQSDSYIISCVLGELQRGSVSEGDRVAILSRTDSAAIWYGTVSKVDYGSTSQDSRSDGEYSDTATRYKFYVQPDSAEGLIIGQHVYVTENMPETDGICISAGFVCEDEDGKFVWADNGSGRLERCAVTAEAADDDADSVVITDGLSLDDFIAYPDSGCAVGAAAVRYSYNAAADAEDAGDGDYDDIAA